MLRNINYKGFSPDPMNFNFGTRPCQSVLHFPEYTIIFFPSGKCRIMGCKKPIDASSLPYNITNVTIQSITVTCDYGQPINLKDLAENAPSMYEPELFFAARLTDFNPLCVNVFHTGQIVITGLKDLDFSDFVTHVFDYILFLTL